MHRSSSTGALPARPRLFARPVRSASPARTGLALALVGALTATAPFPAAAQHLSSSNGVYGGYVASDSWFASMRTSAFAGSSNATWRANIQRALDSGKFVEVSLRVAFPQGNPFPRGRVPELRVKGPDGDVTAHLDTTGTDRSKGASYYLILEKGATYDIAWMAYFGGRESFATLKVLPDDRKQRSVEVAYSPKAARRHTSEETATTPGAANDASSAGAGAGDAKTSTSPYSPPTAGEGLVHPTVGPGYVRPQTGPGYVAPQVGPGYVPPGSAR